MKNSNRKSMLVIACIALVFTVTVGGTLAYLIDVDGPITNIFNPTRVTCAVVEGDDEKVISNTNEYQIGTTKSNVRIQNTGTTAAYIRAAVAANWVIGTEIVAPATVSITPANGWSESTDGYYYYDSPVAPGKQTRALIDRFTTDDAGTAPTGAHLEMTIVCQAIQATADARAEWN